MKSSPEIEDMLALVGLQPIEIKIYLGALELGECSQISLAAFIGIKRTTLREYLPQLIRRGFLEESVRGARKLLTAQDPREVIADFHQRLQNLDDALPLLLALQANTSGKRPEVRYFDGTEGVKRVFEQTLTIGLPIYTFTSVHDIHKELRHWLVKTYVPAREAKKIINYVLVSHEPEVAKLIPSNRFRLNKLVSAESFPFKMEIDIFGDYLSLIHYQEHEAPSATLIQSNSAATTLRSAHQLIWESRN